VSSTQDRDPAPQNRPPKNEAVSSSKFPARLCKACCVHGLAVDLPEPAFPFIQYGDLTISRRHRRSYSITTPSKRNSSTTSHFALSRCGQSYDTTTPSKRNSSATSHFALSRCGQSCSTTNPSKRNSSATSHFALSRCGQSCGTTNPSKRNSSAASHLQ
jgi:hypothetical protein